MVYVNRRRTALQIFLGVHPSSNPTKQYGRHLILNMSGMVTRGSRDAKIPVSQYKAWRKLYLHYITNIPTHKKPVSRGNHFAKFFGINDPVLTHTESEWLVEEYIRVNYIRPDNRPRGGTRNQREDIDAVES